MRACLCPIRFQSIKLLERSSLSVAVGKELKPKGSRRDEYFIAGQHGGSIGAVLLNQSKFAESLQVAFHLESARTDRRREFFDPARKRLGQHRP